MEKRILFIGGIRHGRLFSVQCLVDPITVPGSLPTSIKVSHSRFPANGDPIYAGLSSGPSTDYDHFSFWDGEKERRVEFYAARFLTSDLRVNLLREVLTSLDAQGVRVS